MKDHFLETVLKPGTSTADLKQPPYNCTAQRHDKKSWFFSQPDFVSSLSLAYNPNQNTAVSEGVSSGVLSISTEKNDTFGDPTELFLGRRKQRMEPYIRVKCRQRNTGTVLL